MLIDVRVWDLCIPNNGCLTVFTPYISSYGYPNNEAYARKKVSHKYVLIPWYPISYLTIAGYGFFFFGAYGSLPDAAIWWCLRTGGGGVLTSTSFHAFSGPKWPSSRVGILDTYQNTVLFVRFPSLDATASTPLASTHCQLAVLDTVWRNLPSVASTGLIFIRSENEAFVTTASRRDSHRPTRFLNVCFCVDNDSIFPQPLWVKPHCRPRFERLRGMKSCRYDTAKDSLSPL